MTHFSKTLKFRLFAALCALGVICAGVATAVLGVSVSRLDVETATADAVEATTEATETVEAAPVDAAPVERALAAPDDSTVDAEPEPQAKPSPTSLPPTTMVAATAEEPAPAPSEAAETDEPATIKLSVAKPSLEQFDALPGLSVGSSGDAVRLVEKRLDELGFRVGDLDGKFDYQMRSAVMAFRKHEGMKRNGSVNRDFYERMWDLQGIKPSTIRKTPRVEVDLDRQIAFVVLEPENTVILHISSGGNYNYTNSSGRQQNARTPPGDFVVDRKINGVRTAALGRLYRPIYFNGGIALHGSNSVPSYADSHGCIRLTNRDTDWLWEKLPVGTPVVIHPSMTEWSQHRMITNWQPASGFAKAQLGATGVLPQPDITIPMDGGDIPTRPGQEDAQPL